MLKLGIDIGAQNVKVAVVDDGSVLALAGMPTGFDQLASAEAAIELAIGRARIDRQRLEKISITGVGKKSAPNITTNEINEIASAAAGARFFFPSVRTIIDAGAEEVRAVSLDSDGKIRDFAVNEKCAAGAGSFTEAMAKALEMPIEEFAKISLQSNRKIPMNAQCAIFAESEVVSLIHSGATRGDIARAVHDAIAERISAVARRVGVEKDIVVIGGMAKNIGFVDALKRILETDILVPPNPEYVSAIGSVILE
jgi:benzoyl-CoA reductase subunit D